MKIASFLAIGTSLLYAFDVTTAFSSLSGQVRHHQFRLFSSVDVEAPSDVEKVSVSSAKANLMEIGEKLKAENGFLLFSKPGKDELKAAVEELESTSSVDSTGTSKFLGNWTLLVSTSTNQQGFDPSKLDSFPAYLSDPIKKIRSNFLDVSNKYLVVQQKIRSTNNDGVIDRVDIILEFEPPEQLGDVVTSEIPEQLRAVNLNPLSVSKSKVVLIHKAKILSEIPLQTKITLESVVLNVAGTSQVLDPNGKDIAGFNIPNLGEFLDPNSAEFETTFVDDDIRISRGKLFRGVEQLRVFVRSDVPTIKVNIAEEVEDDEEIVDIEPVDISETIPGSEVDVEEEDVSPSDTDS